MEQNELSQILIKVATDAQLGVIITNSQGDTVWVNNFIMQTTGYSFDEFLGKPPGSILQGPETSPEHIERIRQGLKSGERLETEILNYTKKGNKFWVNLQIDPIRDMSNDIVYFLSVQHDITEMMEKNEQLENFNYLTTHDLINQVGNLNNLISMVSNEGLNEDQLSKMEVIKLTALKLKNTTKDLRKLLSFEGKVNDLQLETIDLHELVEETCVTIGQEYLAQYIKCTKRIDKQIKLKSSRLLLTSIFSNIISNAIKYSDPNKDSTLQISANKKKDKVEITFADNGLGMDLEKNPEKLFKAFKTFHSNPDAIGIGLYLTKKQLDVLGGAIHASSKPGVGSTFTIELPL